MKVKEPITKKKKIFDPFCYWLFENISVFLAPNKPIFFFPIRPLIMRMRPFFYAPPPPLNTPLIMRPSLPSHPPSLVAAAYPLLPSLFPAQQKIRLTEGFEAIEAMKSGMGSIVPCQILPLFAWEELEYVCREGALL
jgi:hypothetical protein